MKNYTKFYYNFDKKYKLVLALFNNYYLNQYSSGGKIKCKILIVGADESVLMKENEFLFKIINELNAEDIARLKKFIPRRNRKLEDKFDKLADIGITDEELVIGIKKRYTEVNSLYSKQLYYEKVEIPGNITIVFSRTRDISELYQKELYTDIVLLDNYSKHDFQDHKDNGFIGGLVKFNEAIDKAKSINKNIGGIKDNDDYLLNIYLTDSDIDIVTILENEIDDF